MDTNETKKMAAPKNYILLRDDLNFSVGSLLAQCSHLSMLSHKAFNQDINLTTIVLRITGNELNETKDVLNRNSVNFVEWLEQPENVISGLAIEPRLYGKDVAKHLKRFKLFK